MISKIRSLSGLGTNLLFQRDNVLALRVRPGEADGKVVGFAARVHQETDGERFRQERRQSARADHQVVVKEAVVCAQQSHLLLAGSHDVRMTVSNCKGINSR